jgi:2-polyprenyl-3-methyl-5-hydroxy-6-metoxy-1,4-benzoquinol methylase
LPDLKLGTRFSAGIVRSVDAGLSPDVTATADPMLKMPDHAGGGISSVPAKCWVCGGSSWKVFKRSTIQGAISSEDFRITDAHYGHTARIDECQNCGFRQCNDLSSVLDYYKALEDTAYDEGREQRSLQARKILESVLSYKKTGRLLDIGAASGILLEQAAQLGFQGEGIEPSEHLARRAKEIGAKVHLGTFPHPSASGYFDVITLIDVLEHVSTPVQLLRDIAAHLKPDGIAVLTTPDVRSLAAGILGPRWWHFRVAHIGYFDRWTLRKALDAAGLEVIKMTRPPWYFTWEYAGERAMSYAPRALRFKMPAFTRNHTVRVNFRDSLQVLFRRKSNAK